MRIVICPDSFKDCASAAAVAAALARGVRRARPEAEVMEIPLADGGEGTVEALVAATGGRKLSAVVTGPRGARTEAAYGFLGDGETAVIEMAAASGLELLARDERNPRVTTTAGTGELLQAALDEGATKLLIGIGGSATNDGGAGLAAALGARLLDSRGAGKLPPGGAALATLAQIDRRGLDDRLRMVDVRVACDVTNPLCGDRGASAVYGPQKGATPEVVRELDEALSHYADIVERAIGRKMRDEPGAGAAGGLGFGSMAFAGATLQRGIEMVLDAVDFDRRIAGADLILTGEGRIDPSTLHGKTVMGVLSRAGRAGIPVVAVAGGVSGDPQAFYEAGLLAAIGLPQRPMTLDEALAEAEPLLEQAGEMVVRLVTGCTISR